MAKDRKKLQHIHSSVPDKQPTPSSLEVGEIAVNNAKNQEFLSLKNSNNKVVRFSSDEQVVTWMEKKEVIPYEGYVRGEEGPTGGTGTNSVTNNDLLNNKSNIIIKLNQVAAGNTVKHDKVNGAKDIYGNLVNPTEDGGLSDGAGFAIDMSRYAMIDANPSFSSLTVTDKTDLSGNTSIKDGDGTGTRTGHTLTIETTDVVATDTNWTETITNRTASIGTNDMTVSGNTTLKVSGTTTETHNGDTVIVNNSNYTVNTIGDTQILSSGNSAFHADGRLGISSKGEWLLISSEKDIIETADNNICETAGNIATFYGVSQTNIGLDCIDGYASNITSINGDTITTIANTASTLVMETDYSGQTLTINEDSSDITSCEHLYINTNDFKLEQCDNGGFAEAEFKFCDEFKIDSNSIIIEECNNGGSIFINETNSHVSGTNFTVNEKSDVTIKAGNDITINSDGHNVNISGDTVNISGDTNIDGALCASSGLCKTLEWKYGDVRNEESGFTNFKDDAEFTIPTSMDHLIEFNGSCYILNHDICMEDNTIVAKGFYSKSDKRLKENISILSSDELDKVENIQFKSFNFKDDESKKKVYGVIAQEVQDAGLENIVHTNLDGMLNVDYTSLLLLKIASMERVIIELKNQVRNLSDRLNFGK